MVFSMTDGGWMVGTTLLIQNRLTGGMESVAAERFDKDGKLIGYVVVEQTREVPVSDYAVHLRPPKDVRGDTATPQ